MAHLARIIDAVEPDTIVTFGPDGMTGHEDHQTVSAWATAAHAARRPGLAAALRHHHRGVRAGLGAVPRRVQHVPRRRAAAAHPGLELAVELRLDADAVDRKIVALRAQASQTTGLFAALGEERVREWWSTETFVEADAAPRPRAGLGHLAGGGMTTLNPPTRPRRTGHRPGRAGRDAGRARVRPVRPGARRHPGGHAPAVVVAWSSSPLLFGGAAQLLAVQMLDAARAPCSSCSARSS